MDYHPVSMKFTKEHAGKWVATKGEKIIATSEKFSGLWEKMNERKDSSEIHYSLIPRGMITGMLV